MKITSSYDKVVPNHDSYYELIEEFNQETGRDFIKEIIEQKGRKAKNDFNRWRQEKGYLNNQSADEPIESADAFNENDYDYIEKLAEKVIDIIVGYGYYITYRMDDKLEYIQFDIKDGDTSWTYLQPTSDIIVNEDDLREDANDLANAILNDNPDRSIDF